MGNAKDTYFQSGGGAGQSASDYIVDNFKDVSTNPTNNTGFTSTASTNPLGKFLVNSDAPKYGYKMLWIKDLVKVDDQTKWINQKPTYEIEFTDPTPGVYAYAYGDVRLRNGSNNISIDVNQIDDGIGVCGIVRKVQFIVAPVADATATADIVTDGSDTGTDVTFSSLPTATVSGGSVYGFSRWHATSNASGLQTKDIHDYRLTPNQAGIFSLIGFAVYFENATTDIDLYPGSTYVDKVKETTSGVTTMALPTVVSPLGANTLIYKTSSNTYQKSTTEISTNFTSSTGSSGTNLLTVTTGHGASYPLGTGIVVTQGSSLYVGSVTNVSTDTLTISPTLSFGIAGATTYKAWYSHATFAISATLFSKHLSFDAAESNVDAQVGTGSQFAVSGDGAKYFSDYQKRYRIWGSNLRSQSQQGYYGVGFAGASGFVQFDFFGSALAVQLASAGGIFHGTFLINGCPGWGVNEGVTGIVRRTIMTDSGPQWNSAVFYPGSSMGTGVVFQTFDVYRTQPTYGQTTGRLASFETVANKIFRPAQNATLMGMGMHRRYYGDDLYFTGGWLRGTTTTAAGGVFYVGSSTNSALRFEYYGREFALIGTAASLNITFDGASIATQMNTGYSIGTLGFHTIAATIAAAGQTAVIQAIDVYRNNSGVKTEQNFIPRSELDQVLDIYEQSDTPRKVKSGDIWAQNKATGDVWIFLFNRWNKVQITASADDPNAPEILVKSHGSSTTAGTGQTSTTENYNFTSWSSQSDSGATGFSMGSGNTGFQGFHYVVDSEDSGGTLVRVTQKFNRAAWSAGVASGTIRTQRSFSNFNNSLCAAKGLTSAPAASTALDTFNGSSWTNGAATFGTAANGAAAFNQNNILHVCAGDNAGVTTTHDTWNGSAVSTGTAVPVSGKYGGNQSGAAGVNGFITAKWDTSGATNSYEWTGSWSSNIAAPAVFDNTGKTTQTGHFQAFSAGVVPNYNTGAVTANTYHFIGSSWIAGVASNSGRYAGIAGVIR